VVGLSVTPVPATITNATLRNVNIGLEASGLALQMSGGQITNALDAINVDGLNQSVGSWSLTNVSLSGNRRTGIRMRGLGAAARQTLTMRNSNANSNQGSGLLLLNVVTADLGTATSPGNNFLLGNGFSAIDVQGVAGESTVTAVGNTWQPSTQGSDASGHYPVTETIHGPIGLDLHTNFSLCDGCSLVR